MWSNSRAFVSPGRQSDGKHLKSVASFFPYENGDELPLSCEQESLERRDVRPTEVNYTCASIDE
jgi:hypothetical protein